MVLTEDARRYLLAEAAGGSDFQGRLPYGGGFKPLRNKIDAFDVLPRLALEEDRFFLVSAHREENVNNPERMGRLLAGVGCAGAALQWPIIVSTYPRTRKRLRTDATCRRRSSPIAKEALDRIAQLYGIEETIKGYPRSSTTKRQQRSKPVAEALAA